MKFKNIFNIKSLLPVAACALMFSATGCVGDLDVDPTINKSTNMEFDRDGNFRKIYANMALTGQVGPAGDADIADIDEGTSDFVRQIWNMNELPTDEAICCWGDPGINEYNFAQWDASHGMITCTYYRLYFGITLANYFLEMTKDDTSEIAVAEKAEARFLRALYYFYAMDFYGDIPFLTKVSSKKAPQAKRADVFEFIETELKECVEEMKEPMTNNYGRADKAAAWMLLSRLYLNAEVYTGKAKWQEAADYAKKVIDSGYELCPDYRRLFMGDNNTNGAEKEIILPILQDGVQTQNFGCSLFLIASTTKDDMENKGTSEGWAGNRARKNLVEKFFPTSDAPAVETPEMVAEAKDDRALFFGKGRNLSAEKQSVFTDGFSVNKFTNVYAEDGVPHDTKFVDMDMPFMRLAEAYLTYAEAQARLGNQSEAKKYIDILRNRANVAGNQPEYSLNDICDEWSREFYFEGRRRMDLVRFGKFGGTTDYKWEWKGGSKNGTDFLAYRNIYGIPSKDIVANENLKQNPGYENDTKK